MAKPTNESATAGIKTKNIAQVIEAQRQMAESRRRKFERRWYDNNFFDDGFHFRFVSRTTGRIVDLANKSDIWSPKRAIPKTSRQLRGMANLMTSFDFHPTVYPERVNRQAFLKQNAEAAGVDKLTDFTPAIIDKAADERVPNPFQEEYEQVKKAAETRAHKIGHWISEEWRKQHIIEEKLPLMILLAMKNSVGWMQVWPDAVHEEIRTQVYDAFDVYCMGHLNDSEDSPFLGKVVQKTIREIKANEMFEESQLKKIGPDNRYASSEIKEAYMQSRYGSPMQAEAAETLLLHEWYIKETVNEENIKVISKQDNGDQIMEDRDYGDTVIRQVFQAGGVWLRDEYVDLPKYPLVPFTMESGPLYQTAQIERFMDANKSLDTLVSRIERYAHTMNVGVWLKKQGEQFKINNAAGGQVISYKQRPPTQGQLSPIPSYMFNLINFFESAIEEQGVTTTTMGKIPAGVKANAAIETLKASEFANLDIPIKQLKRTLGELTERFIHIADNYFVRPKEIEMIDKGEPDYFDIIGANGVKLRKKIKEDVPDDTIVISRDTKVRIELETGPGYTVEGKRENMLQLSQFLFELAQAGFVNPEGLKLAIERLIDTYQFGSVGEFMEAMQDVEPSEQLTDNMKDQIKVAFLEVINDLQQGGQAQPQPPAGQPV